MALNTGLIGQLPYMQKEDTSYLPQSFMHSYEIAKRQNDPLEALRRASIEQDLQIKSFELTKHFEDRQRMIDAEKQARLIAPSIKEKLLAKNPLEAKMAMLDAQVSNSDLAYSPSWNSLGKSVLESVQTFNLLEDNRRQEMLAASTIQHQRMTENKPFASEVDFQQWQKSRDAYQQAQKSGADLETLSRLKSNFDYWEAKTAQRGETVEMTDANGNTVRFTKGGSGQGQGGLTPAVTTELQKKIQANNQSLSLLQESMGKIDPGTVGPAGMVNEYAEKIGNIVKPGSMGTKTTEARQTFRITAQNLFNSLKADSQINKMEGNAMSEIGDITKLDESDPTARKKYGILQDLTALKSVLLYHELGKPVPDEVLKVMSPEQVARAWKRGDLANEEIERWNSLVQLVK